MSIGAMGGMPPMGGMGNIEEMKERMFNRADTDGSGGIDESEFSSIFQNIQDTVDISGEAEELFSQLDVNGDGVIDAEEHSNGHEAIRDMIDTYSPQMVRQNMMQKLDTNGDGALDETELESLASKISEDSGQEINVDDLLAKMDTNGDGVVDTEENEAFEAEIREAMGEAQQFGSASGNPIDILLDILEQARKDNEDDEETTSVAQDETTTEDALETEELLTEAL